MVMRWAREIKIEDLRNHPTELIVTLRKLLAGGAKVTPDPKRTGFYEVESGTVVYYIFASPTMDKILLLATWPKETAIAASCPAA
jgi:hypothetical protein